MLKISIKIVFVIVLCLSSQFSNAQLTDIARLEYSLIPKSKSEDVYTRLRALINYPIQLKNESYFIVGGAYNRIILNLADEYPFDVEQFGTINIIDLNFAYTFEATENWRLGFKFNPRIASTLTKKITKDDFFINGGAYAIKDKTKDKTIEKPYRLILGLTFDATTGIPFPLPFVSYFRRVNEKWSFSLGIPKSNLKYFFNETNMIQAFAGLDGYFANLQEPLILNDRQVENVSLSLAVGGFGYEHYFTKHLVAYIYAGYTFRLNNVLRDKNREEVFKLDDINAFYLRTGLKFKI
jgi:hypothetical protein